jgi:hypothetical protein
MATTDGPTPERRAARGRLRRGLALVLLACGVVLLGIRAWMPFWESRLEGGTLVLLAPGLHGFSVDARAMGFLALVGGGAVGAAAAIAIGEALERIGNRIGRRGIGR